MVGIMARPNRHAIVVSAVTYNALQILSKCRETMDDVVLKAVISYAKTNNISNDPITHANIEAVKRFGEGVTHG
jgi:tRNA(Arg) A34 adenosine deaminase TadA